MLVPPGVREGGGGGRGVGAQVDTANEPAQGRRFGTGSHHATIKRRKTNSITTIKRSEGSSINKRWARRDCRKTSDATMFLVQHTLLSDGHTVSISIFDLHATLSISSERKISS